MMEFTTRKDVIKALEVEMETIKTAYNAANSTSIPCFYSNVVENLPSDLSTFLRFDIIDSSSSIKVTTELSRQVGIATCRISSELGIGSGESVDISDFVEAGFWKLNWEDVLVIDDVSTSTVGSDGSHYIADVLIHYNYIKGI